MPATTNVADPVTLITMQDTESCTAQGFEMPDGIHTVAWSIFHDDGSIIWEIVEHGVYRRTVAKGTTEDMDDPAEIVSAIAEAAPRFFI